MSGGRAAGRRPRRLDLTDPVVDMLPEPTTCIGASLGTVQLMLLCQLLCTRYRIEVEEPEAVRMALAAVPMPMGFRGTVTRR